MQNGLPINSIWTYWVILIQTFKICEWRILLSCWSNNGLILILYVLTMANTILQIYVPFLQELRKKKERTTTCHITLHRFYQYSSIAYVHFVTLQLCIYDWGTVITHYVQLQFFQMQQLKYALLELELLRLLTLDLPSKGTSLRDLDSTHSNATFETSIWLLNTGT